MKQFLHYTLIAVSGILLLGCQEYPPKGEQIIQPISQQPIQAFYLNKQYNFLHMDLYIVADTVNRFYVRGHEGYVNELSITEADGELRVEDENKWGLRNGFNNHIEFWWHTTETENLQAALYGSPTYVYTPDTLSVANFRLTFMHSYGEADLLLHTQETRLSVGGASTIRLSGQTDHLVVSTQSSGPMDARDLAAQTATVKNVGTHNCFVQVHEFLHAEIADHGSIYYTTTPDSLKTIEAGYGEIASF